MLLLNETMSAPQNRAFAGVGRPIKDVVCLVSRLNFAKRRAEKAARTYATKGKTLRNGSSIDG